MLADKVDIIRKLQKEVSSMQGDISRFAVRNISAGLGEIEKAFPGKCFPSGAVHEFISNSSEDLAATNAFIAGIINAIISSQGTCIWVSTHRTVFPPALKNFGINPERIIFIDLKKPKDALWVIEEALKCASISGVIGEIKELSFTESRRLQLAVEESKVTGFIHRFKPRNENTVACLTRWKIRSIPSITDDITGVGFARWHVELVKVRNGRPGSWELSWIGDHFETVPVHTLPVSSPHIKTA